MKTAELIGPALDWAVAKAKGDFQFEVYCKRVWYLWFATHGSLSPHHTDSIWWNPSTDWEQGGPIIERERVSVEVTCMGSGFEWSARCDPMENASYGEYGPTPLIAAMRCYCCAKLGDEIDIPEELQPCQQPIL